MSISNLRGKWITHPTYCWARYRQGYRYKMHSKDYTVTRGFHGYLRQFLNRLASLTLWNCFSVWTVSVYLMCCLLVWKTPYMPLMHSIKRGVLLRIPASFVNGSVLSKVLDAWLTSSFRNWKMSLRCPCAFNLFQRHPQAYSLCHILGSTYSEFPDTIPKKWFFFLCQD